MVKIATFLILMLFSSPVMANDGSRNFGCSSNGLCVDPGPGMLRDSLPEVTGKFGCSSSGLCVDPGPGMLGNGGSDISRTEIFKANNNIVAASKALQEKVGAAKHNTIYSNSIKDSSLNGFPLSSYDNSIDVQNAASLMNTEGIEDTNNF